MSSFEALELKMQANEKQERERMTGFILALKQPGFLPSTL